MKLQVVDKDQVLHLALNPRQAAESLGVSIAHFKREIQPNLGCVYVGRSRLYRVAELDRWLRDNEVVTLADRRRSAA